jgi:geranyl-CoA carboxylase alpha subunit
MLATDEVSPFYDPMVAKVIAYGKTREDAIRLLARAVDDCVLLGVNSNKQFLVNLLRHPIVVAGDTNTAFIQQHFQDDSSLHSQVLSLETLAIAAALFSQSKGTAVWQTGLGVPLPLKLKYDDQQIQLQLSSVNNTFTVQLCDQTVCIEVIEKTDEQLTYFVDGIHRRVQYVLDGDQLYLDRDNGNVAIRNVTYAAPETADVAGDGKIRAPMDGAVINILVNKGDQVVKGQTLLVLEAMKIQQQIRSDVDGVVEDILGQQGQQVKKRQMLFTIQT